MYNPNQQALAQSSGSMSTPYQAQFGYGPGTYSAQYFPRQMQSGLMTGSNQAQSSGSMSAPRQLNCFLTMGPQSITQDQSLSKDFEELYKNEKFADITLLVNDKSYRVHKIVLAARSRLFASIFESRTDNVLQIPDMKTEVMEELLCYIYTGKAEKLDQLAKDLVVAADKYGLEGLKNQCEKCMLKTISVSNAFDLYKFANEKGADELKRAVLKFIVNRFPQIINTEDWNRLNSDGMNIIMLKELCETFYKRWRQPMDLSDYLPPNY